MNSNSAMSDAPVKILLVDDDLEDQQLIREAFAENRLTNEIVCVNDGEELMDYLRRRGRYGEMKKTPLPGLILLDLNIPRKDGRETLKDIKADPELRRIPVVVLTTSKAEEDIQQSYNLGANSYMAKPASFKALVDLVKVLGQYWFEVVRLPKDEW